MSQRKVYRRMGSLKGKQTSVHEVRFGLTSSITGDEARFEVFTMIKIHAEFFWVLTLSSVVLRYQGFGGLCCLHLHFTSLHFTSLHFSLETEKR
jgi:hypothetical protein